MIDGMMISLRGASARELLHRTLQEGHGAGERPRGRAAAAAHFPPTADTTPNLGGVGEEAKAPSRSGSFEDPLQSSRCRRRAVLTTSQDMGFAPPFRFGYPAGEFSSFAFDPVDRRT